MKIERSAAVALFVALGLKNADKWNDQRMGVKLSKIKDMVDDDVALEGVEQGTLDAVLLAIDSDETIEVFIADAYDDADADDSVVTVEADPKPKATKPKAAKAPKAPKAPKEKKVSGPSKAYLAGKMIAEAGGLSEAKKEHVAVLYGAEHSDSSIAITFHRTVNGLQGFYGTKVEKPTRLHIAGRLIAENGIDTETSNLTDMVDSEYGRPNSRESKAAVLYTKDAVRGFQSVSA